jgi:hypothetical protein
MACSSQFDRLVRGKPGALLTRAGTIADMDEPTPPLVVLLELPGGTKLEVDLAYHKAADAGTFFKLVEAGQLRWFMTKADLPSLVNFLHVVRFHTQEAQLPSVRLQA